MQRFSISQNDLNCHSEPIELDNPFLTMDNVIVAPHLASYTRETYETLDKNALGKALTILNDEPLWDVKKPEALRKKRIK